jgi:hypothetical protein
MTGSLLERALADLAEHPNSSAREIARRLNDDGTHHGQRISGHDVFGVLDKAAYHGTCQRSRTGNGPWLWEIPEVPGA